MQKNSFILRLFIFISLLIGIVISLYIAKIFNNPVKQITEIIKRTENLYPLGDNISDLESIRDNIQKIVFHSSDYARQNNLLMEAFIYQAKIKDIYVHVREAKNQFDIKPHYALICFKIHFKAEFFKSELADTSKATFFLKELIGLNISKYFEESITFHIENNQIISTVNVNKNIRDIMPFVEEISEKLKSEEKFAFFTIAVSEIYNDVSELNKVYTRLFDILKRRKLIQKTQILSEKTINLKQNNFYFPMERVEQFLSLLRNAKKDECIQLLDKILEYNFKKEVDSFNIYLLCVELVSCCVKVLIKLYFNVPVSINIRDIYSNFEQCLAKEEYIAQCEEFVKTVIDYIDTHRKKNDYIIEYIQNYIEEHYAEDIYLGMFAERLNLTSAYISWYFKDKLGINLIDYLNDFRIKKAFEFMDNSQLKIKDIAQKVGISNTNTFTRLFKKYSGYTPMDYRKSRCE